MGQVSFVGVVKRYGAATALAGLDLEVAEGEFLSLLGPSGCGKTTALRLLAGFLDPSGGRILMDGKDLAGVAPERRDIGMVFQDYALFPHMTVFENVAFGLRERRRSAMAIRGRVDELLELVQLPGFARRYPGELSGGQQQRVALARALAFVPRLLLMDEPLGALDLKLREAMQTEIQRIQRVLRVTTIYVTHDQGEAIAMSDRIAVMNAGRIAQLDTPQALYDRPRSRFVAEFVGRVNLVPACLVDRRHDRLVLSVGETRIDAARDALSEETPLGAALWAGVRPEQLQFDAPETTGSNRLPARLVSQAFAGNMLKFDLDIGGPELWHAERPPGDPVPAGDTGLCVSWAAERTIVLNQD